LGARNTQAARPIESHLALPGKPSRKKQRSFSDRQVTGTTRAPATDQCRNPLSKFLPSENKAAK